MDRVRVYQLGLENRMKFYRFDENNIPDKSVYNVVFDGELQTSNAGVQDRLEDIFCTLNVGKKPEGYRGHSLSVSDVVELDGEFWYVDSIGFRKMPW